MYVKSFREGFKQKQKQILENSNNGGGVNCSPKHFFGHVVGGGGGIYIIQNMITSASPINLPTNFNFLIDKNSVGSLFCTLKFSVSKFCIFFYGFP